MNRIDRLFAITTLLQARKRLRAQDLAREFEVTERTIYRDMAALAESGVPVVGLPSEGYELMAGYFLPPLRFTLREARAMLIGARLVVSQARGSLPADAQSALNKVAAQLPTALRDEVQQLTDAIGFAFHDQFDLDDPKVSQLQKAIQQRRVVWLRYHSYSQNEVTEREIEPLGMNFNGEWYVGAYCRLRKGARDFRLDRIDALKVLDATFKPRQLMRPERELVEIHIRFAPERVRWVRERQHYGYLSDVSADKNGTVMRFAIESYQEFHEWLFQWGASAELLSPPLLRQMRREEVAKMARSLIDEVPCL